VALRALHHLCLPAQLSPPNVQQANLGIEYLIRPSLSVQVTICGSKGTHLTRTLDINHAGPETPVTSASLIHSKPPREPHHPAAPIAGFARMRNPKQRQFHLQRLTVQLNKRRLHNYQFLLPTLRKVNHRPTIQKPLPSFLLPPTTPRWCRISEPSRGSRPGRHDQRNRLVFKRDLDSTATRMPCPVMALRGRRWQLSGITDC